MEADVPAKRDDLLIAVGKRIKNLRLAKKVDAKDISAASGFKAPYLSRVEGGRQNLSLRTLARIAAALDVSMSDILVGIEASNAEPGPRPYRRQPKSDRAATRK